MNTNVSRQRLSQLRHPERHRAQLDVAKALKSGKLIRPQVCSQCGAIGKVEGHHPDYLKRLEVVWLCKPCHAKLPKNPSSASAWVRPSHSVECPICLTAFQAKAVQATYCSIRCRKAASRMRKGQTRRIVCVCRHAESWHFTGPCLSQDCSCTNFQNSLK